MTTLTRTWNEAVTQSSHRARAAVAILWALQLASAVMFLFSGTLKLIGVPLMVQEFGTIGIGQWFRYLTGTIEIVSAVWLLVPSLAVYGAVALAMTMVGAVAAHLFILGGSPAPAIVLLASTSTIAWLRRDRVRRID